LLLPGLVWRDLVIAHGEKGVSAALRYSARLEDIFAVMEVAPRVTLIGVDGDAVGDCCRLQLCLIVLKVLVIAGLYFIRSMRRGCIAHAA
jgi:hypothetical protein